MRSYADQLKMKLRQFENYTEGRKFREKNTRRRAERRAEVTPEERIQDREINATHQRASRTRCGLRFVGTATGEVEVVQEQVNRHQLPPMERNMPVCQAVEWKDYKQQIVVGEKLCVHRCMILLKSSNSCLNTKCFYSRSRSWTASLYFRPCEHRLRKMSRLMSNWQTLEKELTRSVFTGKKSSCGTLLPAESRTPSSVQLYVFESDTEVRANVRCCIMDGLDRKIMAKVQRVLSPANSFVELFLRTGEFISNQEVVCFLLDNSPASEFYMPTFRNTLPVPSS